MLQFVADSLWFYAPAYLANLAPYLWSRFFGFDMRLDRGLTVFGQDLIGPSRSLGGVYCVISVSLVFGLLTDTLLASLHMGLGALSGSIFNSILKRRLKIQSGGRFQIFDETDFLIGGALGYLSYSALPWKEASAGILLGAAIHRTVNIFVRPLYERMINHQN
ncbi:CDP-archaeol synthase [bacterium]|nr:CDP-archaeol synthase [bacterium]